MRRERRLRNDGKVFEKMYGDFAPDRRVAVASASKIISGLFLFRLVEQCYLSLDSTTAEVMGWTPPPVPLPFACPPRAS